MAMAVVNCRARCAPSSVETACDLLVVPAASATASSRSSSLLRFSSPPVLLKGFVLMPGLLRLCT